MNLRIAALLAAQLLNPAIVAVLGEDPGDAPQVCADPAAAIVSTLDCIGSEDALCATAGYNSAEFKKYHNGIDTQTVIDEGSSYWSGAFTLVDLSLDVNHVMNVGPNQASIRYVEKVVFTNGTEFGLPPSNEYPFGSTFFQYEHALVTVDKDCKMVLWDQYGDNKEQLDVDLTALVMLCALGIYPEEICNSIPQEDSNPCDADEGKNTKAPKSSKRGEGWERNLRKRKFSTQFKPHFTLI